MKNWLMICLFIFILLITGCDQTERVIKKNFVNEGTEKPENMEKPNPNEQKEFLEKPKIIFSSEHSYRPGDGWLGNSTEITGNYFKASGDSIFLEVIFETVQTVVSYW